MTINTVSKPLLIRPPALRLSVLYFVVHALFQGWWSFSLRYTVKYLQIVNWSTHFEVNRSRELKRARWVAIPNKHDGDGYTDLVDGKNGPENFAAWILIVQVASKCEVRGTLVRDTGTPHTSGTLARMTSTPKKIFDNAIPKLIEIGWLQEVTKIPQEGAIIPQEGATIQDSTEQDSTEQDTPLYSPGGNGSRKGGNRKRKSPEYTEPFGVFWIAYPRKEKKAMAFDSWNNNDCEPLLPKILESIERFKESDQWTKDGGQFIPHPTTWLNQRRWEDEPPEKVWA